MILSKNKKTHIILPKEPTAREQFAAEELVVYLKRMFGIDAAFAKTAEVSANVFLIGGPARNAASAVHFSEVQFNELLTGAEGMLIDIKGDTVLLAGSEGYDDAQRGTVYAVYEFLERYLGCTLAAYSAPGVCAGERVPVYDMLTIEDDRYVKAGADRPYRTAIIQYGEAAGNPYHQLNKPFIDWLAKNRYNRILTWASVYEAYKKMGLLEEFEKRGIRLSVGHHESSRMWLPYFGNEYFTEAYAETHPEYYRLNADGTRFTPQNKDDHTGQWIYCSRNTDCIEQISQNLIRWVKENPLVDTIAFWPNDGIFEQCSCEKCAAHSKVENYTYFQNEVAKRVSAACPQIKIDMLVYVDLWECPEDVKLENCLQIDEAAWAKEQRKCGKPDGTCLSETEFETNIMRWRKAGADVVYYDYYMGVYGNRQRIIPMADEIQAIWQRFAALGISGAGTQIECFNLWNHLMNLYTFGRTAYDATLSFEDNLNALCKLFGAGGPAVAQAIRLMEAALDGEEIIGFAGKYMIEHVDKAKVYDLFEKALAAAEDVQSRNNIRLVRMAFRYSEIETADPANLNRETVQRFQAYEDASGELAYMAVHFDSFRHNDPGYGIAFPILNTDVKEFKPDKWFIFE
ncbi:MAG: DUF4838 domain-containing protein [Clostridiales bacterium]|nr:DUF4838 domain-containing protein [Clostridiales bacterium]